MSNKEEFFVNTDGLRQQLTYMEMLAQAIGKIGSSLEAELGKYDKCWGEDATGRQFYDGYAGPMRQIVDGTPQLASVVTGMHDGVETMGEKLKRLEEENVRVSQSLSPTDVHTDGGSSGVKGHRAP